MDLVQIYKEKNKLLEQDLNAYRIANEALTAENAKLKKEIDALNEDLKRAKETAKASEPSNYEKTLAEIKSEMSDF